MNKEGLGATTVHGADNSIPEIFLNDATKSVTSLPPKLERPKYIRSINPGPKTISKTDVGYLGGLKPEASSAPKKNARVLNYTDILNGNVPNSNLPGLGSRQDLAIFPTPQG